VLRLLARCLAAHLLLSLCASSAFAGELIEGDGFRVDVPHGFRRVPSNTPNPAAVQRIKLTEGLTVEGSPEVLACVAGLEISPDAVLLVTRMNLKSGSEIGTVAEMQQYLLRSMSLTQRQFDEHGKRDGIHIRNTRVGDYDAIEIIHTGDNTDKVDGKPSRRVLSVLGGDFLLVVALINLDGGDAGTPLVWKSVIASLQIDAPGVVAVRAVLYGGLGFFLLLIILFVRRLHGSSKPKTSWVDRNSSGSALSMEGWGNGMSLDDAPAMSSLQASAPADPVPAMAGASAGASAGGPSLAQDNGGMPPGLSRTLPSSPLREIPNSLPTPPASPSGPAAGRPTPPPPVSLASASTPGPIQPDGSAVVQAPRPLPPVSAMPSASSAHSVVEEGRSKGGLHSPLSPSGRWSPQG